MVGIYILLLQTRFGCEPLSLPSDGARRPSSPAVRLRTCPVGGTRAGDRQCVGTDIDIRSSLYCSLCRLLGSMRRVTITQPVLARSRIPPPPTHVSFGTLTLSPLAQSGRCVFRTGCNQGSKHQPQPAKIFRGSKKNHKN